MVTTATKRTASEIVLLAAADLAATGNQEFSEWDLTVAAWSLDRFRFGLRGYHQSYPDHKRVMMEIMGNKPSSPVQQKYLEKVRPNFYRLTPLGKAAAARLRSDEVIPKPSGGGGGGAVTVKDLYEIVSGYVARPEFRRWQDNPEEPKEWQAAASFLGLNGRDADLDPTDRMDEVQRNVQDAMDWCKVNESAFLTRGSGQGGTPIHVRDLANMLDFLLALSYRFPKVLRKRPGGPKPRR